MALPASFLQHLREKGYHPRSDKHSNALAKAIVSDLVANCDVARERASQGKLVYELNFDLIFGSSTWNVDLVLGEPPLGAPASSPIVPINRTKPSTVQIAVEIKAVMTEHRKAIKNRKRDLEAHHEHVRRYSADTVSGGVMILNVASVFRSPTVAGGKLTTHKAPEVLLAHCMNEVRNISTRGDATGIGLDAKTAVVLNMTNIDLQTTTYYEKSPAPVIGDPVHYDAFIQKLCNAYRSRFS